MNSIRFLSSLGVLVFAAGALATPSGPRVIQVPQPTPMKAANVPQGIPYSDEPFLAKSSAVKVKLFDAFEHQWQGTGTKRTRPRYGVKGKKGFFFTSGLMIDADGSPRAFHRVSSKGLDDLQNAGHAGNWWGILTNNGETWGKPIVQSKRDPAPGFYISPTGLEDTTKRETDPRRFVDAVRVPYIVLSGTAKQNGYARMGDYAVVFNKANGKWAFALCGDTWDEVKIGEGSVALAKKLGINADPRNGGVDDGVVFLIFPGSRKTPWRAEETPAQTNAAAQKALNNWGGIAQLKALSR